MTTRSAAGSLARFAPWAGEGARVYVRPVGLMPRAVWAAGAAVPLAGGRFSFNHAELIARGGGRIERAFAPLAEIMAWGMERSRAVAETLDRRLGALTRTREPYAGFDLSRPVVMGIVNVTPDSFSDGGDHADADSAVRHGLALLEAGADILDVGGESTRPGAAPVSPEDEAARVVPVIRELAGRGARVSVDTRNAAVMEAALGAGAVIINDIAALTGSGALDAAARSTAAVALMHMRGIPGTMQTDPVYDDAALDVFDWLEERVAACLAAGIPLSRIAVDPGIGFGKTVAHNLDLMRQTALFHGLGAPLLIGVSRKTFIAKLSRGEAPKDRLAGSLAAGFETLGQGAQILRVHDVAETAQARAVWEGLNPL
jgi:dihydropteroate synthase